MPRLFIKIFLWFWLAMTLIGAILVGLALTTNPRQAYFDRQKKRLTEYGNQLVRIYEEKGSRDLTARINQIHAKERFRLVLIDFKTQSLGEQPEQPLLRDFARRALIENLLRPLPREIRPQGGIWGRHFAIPLEKDYVLLVEMPRPSQLELLLDPHALTLRLGLTFLVAGVICYLLARSITMPIMKLREAAQDFARGRLDTRVSARFGHEKGELAELARDFDTMAGRIEMLLNSQQRLLRDISHELRSPLARLGVALELARRNVPEESLPPLYRIEKESGRLNELIGQLLTITQLENQTGLKASEEVDLKEILEAVVRDANYESQADNRRVSLAAEKPVMVEGSRELLGRAFENVIRNALKYTPGEGTVEVSLDLPADGRFAEVRIRDHGPGVPSSSLQEIFRPFYRVSESRNQRSGGAGVGLAIAKRAISLHQGGISAANCDDGGLLITVRLPVIADRQAAGSGQSSRRDG